MEELEILINWLKRCEVLAAVPIGVDHLDKMPPAAAVYPKGLTVLWRREDVLGRWQERCRLRCLISARFAKSGDGYDAAQSWLELQKWVQMNPAPLLGEAQVSHMEKGKLAQETGDGTVIYEAVLTVEYTKAG